MHSFFSLGFARLRSAMHACVHTLKKQLKPSLLPNNSIRKPEKPLKTISDNKPNSKATVKKQSFRLSPMLNTRGHITRQASSQPQSWRPNSGLKHSRFRLNGRCFSRTDVALEHAQKLWRTPRLDRLAQLWKATAFPSTQRSSCRRIQLD